MDNIQQKLKPLRIWLLSGFILSSTFIAGNSLLSAEESGDLSTGISEVIISFAKAILPPAEVVIVPAEAITLKLKDDVSQIYIGTSNRITATFSPINTTDKSLTWNSSNPSIIEVTNGGIAVARDFGLATITAMSHDENIVGSIAIEVVDFPQLEDFSIEAFIGSNPTTTLQKNTSAKVKLNDLSPNNAKTTDVTFSSSNLNIAEINQDGVIYGLATGEVVITATSSSITKSIELSVVDEGEVILPTTFTLIGETVGYIGRTFSLIPSFGDTIPTDQQVTFTSSNTRVAKVNDEGWITPVNFSGYTPQTVTIHAYPNANPLLEDSLVISIEKVFPLSLQITSNSEVENGKTMTISPTFYPLDVTDRQLTYTSSNPELATVSSAGDFGVILGKGIGVVMVTATSVMDPSIQATLEIEIVPATLITPDMIVSIYLFVRKGIGHMGLNFINGIFGFLTFFSFLYEKKNRYLWISIITGLGLGLIFEGLQFFAPGRSPVWIDVMYNTLGYTFAQLLLFSIMLNLNQKRKSKIQKRS